MRSPTHRWCVSGIGSNGSRRVIAAIGCLFSAAAFNSTPAAADTPGILWLHCEAAGNSQTVGVDPANKQVIIYSSSETHMAAAVFRESNVAWSDDNDAFHGFINRQTLAYRFTILPVRNPNAGGNGKCQKIADPTAGH
jgi:hypothetical protein